MKIEDVIQRIPEHKLLKKATMKVYQKTGQWPIENYKDDYGVFGRRYSNFILCAKESQYGDLVSCHKRLVFEGIIRKVPILMWVDEHRTFLAFDPHDIQGEGVENMKGWAEMINFPVSIGKDVKL